MDIAAIKPPSQPLTAYAKSEIKATKKQITHLKWLPLEAQDALVYSQFAIAKFFDHRHEPLREYQVGQQAYVTIAKKSKAGYHLTGINYQKLAPQLISCLHLEPAPPGLRIFIELPPISIEDDTGDAHYEVE
ncbi:hypothetical protein BJ508DRAFT_332348 [Ascobolus immersus RN42]|uniref:Uncharacterized protein n=1 Tax=Ascobolus immersus RN42 TaxID=1160509 RepID=A0A3N4HTA4_ASCIM|nr:hypothetical protein BJ508DRAFT_332348 [Ascobolus immersus RN42]